MATFTEAFKTCLTEKYITFEGRASRSEYWYFVLFMILCYVAASIIDGVLGLFVLYPLTVLAFLIPSIAAGVRRLHDTDKSGWWMLISLIPLVGFIVLIVLLCLRGTDGENRFGPPVG